MSDKSALHGASTPGGVIVLPEVVRRFQGRLRVVIGDASTLSDGDLAAWAIIISEADDALRAECMRRFPEFLDGDPPVN